MKLLLIATSAITLTALPLAAQAQVPSHGGVPGAGTNAMGMGAPNSDEIGHPPGGARITGGADRGPGTSGIIGEKAPQIGQAPADLGPATGATPGPQSDSPRSATNPPTPLRAQPTDPGAVQQGEPVRKAQEALNQQGYNVGEANGVMNEPTRDAVRRFQELSGIQPTGALDPATLRALGVNPGM